MCPPPRPIVFILMQFLGKFSQVICWWPLPFVVGAPYREILDPPLHNCKFLVSEGDFCEPVNRRLFSSIMETFEGGISLAHWQSVSGGTVGLGCGPLRPHAHGKTLYFQGCGMRQVTTVELDTTRTRYSL